MSAARIGRRWRSWNVATVVLVVVAILVGAGIVGAIWAITGSSSSSSTASTCDVVNVADRVLPSVVTLQVGGSSGSGTGSGVVVQAPLAGADTSAPEGTYILTNEHVIAPGGQVGEVRVIYAD